MAYTINCRRFHSIIASSYANNSNLAKLLKLYNDILINTGKGEIIDV